MQVYINWINWRLSESLLAFKVHMVFHIADFLLEKFLQAASVHTAEPDGTHLLETAHNDDQFPDTGRYTLARNPHLAPGIVCGANK